MQQVKGNSLLKINIAKFIPFHEEEITTNKGKTKCNSKFQQLKQFALVVCKQTYKMRSDNLEVTNIHNKRFNGTTYRIRNQ